MQITFIRAGERQNFSTALRDDGVTVRVPGYGPGLPLPHDLAHAVVERELGLRRGFWASVAAGALFPGMVVLAGRQRPHAAERSRAVLKENGAYVGQAEVLVGTLLEIIEQDLDHAAGAAQRRLAAAQGAVRAGAFAMDDADIVRVYAALRDAASGWQQLGVGGHMTVAWDLSVAVRTTRRVRDRRRGVVLTLAR